MSDPPSSLDRNAISVEVVDPIDLAFKQQSDFGNSERLIALAQGKLKWVDDLQLWAWYDGRRFDVERGAIEAQRLAHAVIGHIRIEAEAVEGLTRGAYSARTIRRRRRNRWRAACAGMRSSRAAPG
jgi:MoxR-like ATPase